MAHIYGQIETLKQIRNQLDAESIYRFNSLREFDTFLENYESEKTSIYQRFEKEVDNDILLLRNDIKYNKANLDKISAEIGTSFEIRINKTLERKRFYNKINRKTFWSKYLSWLILIFLNTKATFIRYHHKKTLRNYTKKIESKIERDSALLNEYVANRNSKIDDKSATKIRELEQTKEVVLRLRPLIAGAIGENMVVNEIKKLSDDYTLINDFSLSFNPPIYNRKKNDRIYSIQIDHLLISKAGLFILETKNWSKQSIQSLNMRSPIEQVRRASYALFVALNSEKNFLYKNSILNNHHWGRKSIPIRNVVVMINEKPEGEFGHVKVKSLNELNSYIEFFEPIFNDNEYDEISKSLINLQH